LQGTLLPALAKLALDGDAGIRDAAQGGMVVFAVKAGSVGVLDKVGLEGCWQACVGSTVLQVLETNGMHFPIPGLGQTLSGLVVVGNDVSLTLVLPCSSTYMPESCRASIMQQFLYVLCILGVLR